MVREEFPKILKTFVGRQRNAGRRLPDAQDIATCAS
jgi:hypothetical protein